jgi:hypothetical protein
VLDTKIVVRILKVTMDAEMVCEGMRQNYGLIMLITSLFAILFLELRMRSQKHGYLVRAGMMHPSGPRENHLLMIAITHTIGGISTGPEFEETGEIVCSGCSTPSIASSA